MNTENILTALDYLLDAEQAHFEEYLENEGNEENHIYFIAKQAKADLLNQQGIADQKTIEKRGSIMFYVLVKFTSLSTQEERGAYETEAEALDEAIECLRSGYIVEMVEE